MYMLNKLLQRRPQMAAKLCWHTLSKIWRRGEKLGLYPYCYCTLYTLSFSNGGERFTNVFAINTGERAYVGPKGRRVKLSQRQPSS
jgi:hypothetical protein